MCVYYMCPIVYVGKEREIEESEMKTILREFRSPFRCLVEVKIVEWK